MISAALTADLLQRAEDWLSRLRQRDLVAEPAAAELADVLRRSVGERLDRVEDPLFVVMLCGPTAVGKSSIINALARGEISATGLGATTSAAIVYVHEQDDPARLFEYSTALGELASQPTRLVRHASEPLLHTVVVDTPDIDSVLRQHRELTAELVHSADLVLFVTSPQKYKSLQGVRWVAEQRQQRAIAFVLNKWDRDELGLHYEQRHRIAEDFASLLAREGFQHPVVFTVSTLKAEAHASSGLSDLHRWLETGIDESAANSIRDRRRAAAWARLRAAIVSAMPLPLDRNEFLGICQLRLKTTQEQASRLVQSEASALSSRGLSGRMRPVTPGPLSSWLAMLERMSAALSSIVSIVRGSRGMLGSTVAGRGTGIAKDDFGQPAVEWLTSATRTLTNEAERRQFPLGPIQAEWTTAARELRDSLRLVPDAVAAEVVTRSLKASLRRGLGTVCLVAVDIAIVMVLAFAVYRLGWGLTFGNYVPPELLFNVLAFVIVMLPLGQFVANLFFPPLHARFRRAIEEQAGLLVARAIDISRTAVSDQVTAAASMIRDGNALTAEIDTVLGSLNRSGQADSADVRRLFGESAVSAVRQADVPADERASVAFHDRHRAPKFD